MSRRRLALACVALALLVGGCGYSFVRYGGGLGDVRRVAIRGLVNDSFEPGVEALVSDALTREFRQRGALRLVDDPDAADLVIGGAVKRVADIVAEIASASREQSDGVQQVDEMVTQMESVTQKNASLVEESTASLSSVDRQVDGMLEVVSFFDVAHDDARRLQTGLAKRVNPASRASMNMPEDAPTEPQRKGRLSAS